MTARKKKKDRFDSLHPVVGQINFTKHLVSRCLERVFEADYKEADYEIKCKACEWLGFGISKGKALKWYRNYKGVRVLTSESEPAVLVGEFVVVLAKGRRHGFIGKTMFPCTGSG